MFMSVYFHHVPIGYEAMLRRFYADGSGELTVPANAEDYLFFDDVHLFTVLRQSKSEWARRIVERRAYRMLVEVKHTVGESRESPDLDMIAARLESAGIQVISHSAQGVLSKYSTPDLFIVEEGRPFPVQEYTPLYRRYAGAIQMKRIYVDPDRFDDARKIGGISLSSPAAVD
jgi:HD superfamily phosphohydrolase